MATTFKTYLSPLLFTSELPTIVCLTDGAIIDFVIGTHSTVIYSTRLYSFNGEVSFYDIQIIIERYFSQNNKSFDTFYIQADDAVLLFSSIMCTSALSMSAREFYNNRFLSTAPSKFTTIDNVEYVHWFHSNAPSSIKLVAYEALNGVVVQTTILTELREYTSSGIDSFTITRDLFAQVRGRVLCYVIFVNARMSTFYIKPSTPTLTFKFRNIFGLFESVSFWGGVTEIQSTQYNIGVLSQAVESYDLTTERSFNFVSAPMSLSLMSWLKEFFVSPEIFLNEAPVIIIQSRYEVSFVDDADNAISFNYRYKSRVPLTKVTPLSDDIFSQQFNPIFD